MKAPNIIYLQVCGDCRIHELDPNFCNTSCDFDDLAESTWCKDKVWNSDIAYYSEEAVKDAVIDMLNHGNIDNYDEAIAYLLKRLNPTNPLTGEPTIKNSEQR